MRMNTPGKHDGQMELWIDGKSVIRADGLVIRGDGGQGDHKVKGDGARFKGMHFQTFFGGKCIRIPFASIWPCLFIVIVRRSYGGLGVA